MSSHPQAEAYLKLFRADLPTSMTGSTPEVRCYDGAIHGFFGLPGFLDQAIEAREYAAARLVGAFR